MKRIHIRRERSKLHGVRHAMVAAGALGAGGAAAAGIRRRRHRHTDVEPIEH